MEKNIQWQYRMRIGGPPKTIRERAGDALRKLASKIDYRLSASIEMTSWPPLSNEDRICCLLKGFDHAEELFKEQVRLQAVEAAMRKVSPHLYEDQTNETNL